MRDHPMKIGFIFMVFALSIGCGKTEITDPHDLLIIELEGACGDLAASLDSIESADDPKQFPSEVERFQKRLVEISSQFAQLETPQTDGQIDQMIAVLDNGNRKVFAAFELFAEKADVRSAYTDQVKTMFGPNSNDEMKKQIRDLQKQRALQ